MLYLDNAATTPVLPEVRDVMLNYIADNYGNPSSIYKIGRMNKIALKDSSRNYWCGFGRGIFYIRWNGE